MKRIIRICLGLAAIWSFSAMAANFGVVNMQTLFQDVPQVKKINTDLESQFKTRKDDIETMGKQLQSEIQEYQKNKSVMSASNLSALESKITDQETKLRGEQVKFQQDLFQAQNKAMADFMSKLRGVVQQVAKDKNLDLVLPENSVLYSKDGADITSEVVDKLK